MTAHAPQQLCLEDSSDAEDYDGNEDHDGQDFFDEGLSDADVLGRIEEFVADYLSKLTTSGNLPDLEVISQNNNNHTYQNHAEAGLVVAVTGGAQRRSLMAKNGNSANRYVRVFHVMQAVHELLRAGRSATQRDLYYWLQRPPLFTSPKDVGSALHDVMSILRVPRASLGLTCSSRGAVAGQMYIRDNASSPWQDCTKLGSAGKAIPGDLAAVNSMSFRCSASYLLVIEKDAIFQRLVEDKLWSDLPCVLVTAKGMPDLATRAFCSKLMAAHGGLTALGLVDYNPSGFIILRTYKFGSHRNALESSGYALPSLHWLGVRSSWLVDLDADSLLPLESRDLSLIPGIKKSLVAVANIAKRTGATQRTQHDDGNFDDDCYEDEEDDDDGDHSGTKVSLHKQMQHWQQELEIMESAGYKADIEAVYSLVGYAGLKDMLVHAVVNKDYL